MEHYERTPGLMGTQELAGGMSTLSLSPGCYFHYLYCYLWATPRGYFVEVTSAPLMPSVSFLALCAIFLLDWVQGLLMGQKTVMFQS